MNEEPLKRSISDLKKLKLKETPGGSLRSALKKYADILARCIRLEQEVGKETVLRGLQALSHAAEVLASLETHSEHSAIEKHSITLALTRAVVLSRIQHNTKEVREAVNKLDEKHRFEVLSDNLKVAEGGEIKKRKSILAESLFLGVLQTDTEDLRQRIKTTQAMKEKARAREVMEGRPSFLDAYMASAANEKIIRSVEALLPITHSIQQHKLCAILEGILESGDSKYIKQLLGVQQTVPGLEGHMYGPGKSGSASAGVGLSTVLSELDQKVPGRAPVHVLILRMARIYMQKAKKREGPWRGIPVLGELFDDDQIDVLIKSLETSLSPDVQSEIISILAEAGIRIQGMDAVSVNRGNIRALMKYFETNPTENEGVLGNILSALEVEGMDEEEEAVYSPPLVLGFFVRILRYYTANDTANSLAVQKYIAGPVLEICGRIVEAAPDPVTTERYLKMLALLIGLDRDADAVSQGQPAPHGSPAPRPQEEEEDEVCSSGTAVDFVLPNPVEIDQQLTDEEVPSTEISEHPPVRDYIEPCSAPSICATADANSSMLYTKCIGTILAALKQISTFSILDDMAYAEAQTYQAFGEDEEPQQGSRPGSRPGTLRESVELLFRIGQHLPDTLKVVLASPYIMNVLFRTLAKDRKAKQTTRQFIRGFFSCRPVVQKIMGASDSSFFVLLLLLVRQGLFGLVLCVIENSPQICHGIVRHESVPVEVVREYREVPALYSLLAAVLVHFHRDTSQKKDARSTGYLGKLCSTVFGMVKSNPYLEAAFCEMREFFLFFKAAVLLEGTLGLQLEDMLHLLVKSQTPEGYAGITTEEASGSRRLSPKKDVSVDLLYAAPHKMVAEAFFFYHFVTRGDSVALAPSRQPNEDLLCLNELLSCSTSTALKYVSLLGLAEGKEAPTTGAGSPHSRHQNRFQLPSARQKEEELAKRMQHLRLDSFTEEERRVFASQIYRAFFLTGKVVQGSKSLANPFAPGLGKSYNYNDMCVRAAIRSVEIHGTLRMLPHSVLSGASPHLVSALLYVLYESAPNSSVVVSYVRRMKQYAGQDASVFARVLATASV